LAKAHVVALEKVKEKGFHVYNLGTGNGTSVLQLASAFEKASGVTIKIVNCPRRPGDA